MLQQARCWASRWLPQLTSLEPGHLRVNVDGSQVIFPKNAVIDSTTSSKSTNLCELPFNLSGENRLTFLQFPAVTPSDAANVARSHLRHSHDDRDPVPFTVATLDWLIETRFCEALQ